MAAQNLTAALIQATPHPPSGQTFLWDAKLKGLGVRVTKSAKTFICQDRVKGRTRRVTLAPVGTYTVAEARNVAKKTLGQMASDIDPNKEKAEARAKTITLQEALNQYLEGRALKPATIVANRNVVTHNYGDWLNKELRSITPKMVEQRFDKINARSASIANLATRVLRAVWNYARAATATDTGEYTLPDNPCQRVSDLKKWNKPKRRQLHLTSDQFPAFFEALASVEADTESNRHPDAGRLFAAFCELVLRTGLRKNEAATLTWDRVNFADRTFAIPPELAKNGKELVLPMSSQVYDLLTTQNERTEGQPYVWGNTPMGDPRKTLERLRTALDMPLRFHDLRRSFAVICERCDVSYIKLKRMMNHADNGDVTAGYLVSTDPERLRQPMQQVSDEIDRLAALSETQSP